METRENKMEYKFYKGEINCPTKYTGADHNFWIIENDFSKEKNKNNADAIAIYQKTGLETILSKDTKRNMQFRAFAFFRLLKYSYSVESLIKQFKKDYTACYLN